MGFLRREQALEIAGRLVEASQADETEVAIESAEERFVRFADTGPTQSGDRERHIVAVRARLRSEDGWREGRATCDGYGERETEGALSRAHELARVAPPNGELVSLEGALDSAPPNSTVLDEATLAHGFDAKAQWVQAALAACKAEGLQPAGLGCTSGYSRVLVNSSGREVFDARSRAALSLTASAAGFAGGAGFADDIACRIDELDHEEVIRRAVQKSLANRDPRPIPAEEYTVLLEPNAVSSMLLFAAYQGFGAQDVHEEASFLCGRVGQRCFPEQLSIDDHAQNEVYQGFAFDGEGSPRRKVELVRQGVLTGPVTDSDWARKLGTENTGHALPKPNTIGPKPMNLIVRAGQESMDELIAGIDRGLVVTQFHYTNLIDPKDLMLTGMTRNGTFLVEAGEVVGSVKNLRFTESLMNAFSRISGVGREREVAGALFDGEVITPALRIDGFRFTSTTDF